MHFICKYHQQTLLEQPYDQLASQWFKWMDQASMYYDIDLRQQVLAYAGSAVDLSLIMMSKATGADKASAAKKLVLACIYLTNCLRLEKEPQKAHFYQTTYHQVLLGYFKTLANTAVAAEVKEGLEALADNRYHYRYFNQHLNLKINDTAASSPANTLH